MKNITIFHILSISIVLLFSHKTFSVSDDIPKVISFQNILLNRDIDVGAGSAFYQDSDGFMWIGGGNALFRFDGYEFKQIDFIQHDNSKKKQPVNFTVDIFEDSRKNLWIGSKVGLLFYNREKGILTKLKDIKEQSVQISQSTFFDIDQLASGEIIAASRAGLFIIDPLSFQYKVFTPNVNKKHWLNNQIVRSIHIGNGDDIWLGTDSGLEYFNWKAQTFTLHSISANDSPAENRVTDIVADGENHLWLSTSHGLVHYNLKSMQAKRYVHDPNDRFSIAGNDIWRLVKDSKGILWTASDDAGLSAYDKEKDHFINHRYEAGRDDSLSTDKLRTVYEDKNGDIWVGGHPVGIGFFDRSSAAFESYAHNVSNPKSLSHNIVLSVVEDKDENLWLGTDGGGLNFFDRNTGEFTHYTSDVNDPSSLSSNSVLTVFIDSAGLIWTGTWGGGFASLDPSTQKFTAYPFDLERAHTSKTSSSQRLNSAHVWHINEDSDKNLWIATYSGGISKFDRKTGIFTHYTNVAKDSTSLINNMAWSTFEDSMGNFWVGTVGGLSLMDREKETFSSFYPDPNTPNALSNEMVLSIYEDAQQRLWIGTGKGLNLFDRESKTFTVFDKDSGLINDYIKTIVGDQKGNIWVSTNNGFSSLDPKTGNIKNYNRINGRLVGDFAMHSGTLSQRGEVILGGTKGLRIIKPNAVQENKAIPNLAFTDLKIFSESIQVGDKTGLLNNTINHTQTITLDYTQSMFEFSFTALNFRSSEKNQYSYKLEGFSNNWLNASTQRTAKYTNLNPGTYQFRVKGSNNDGTWNKTGKSITIVQLPPPWRTWWAYTLYVLLILGTIFVFILSQLRKRRFIEEQNRILEAKVVERTAEVVEKTKNIHAMLSNIPQGIFVIEDDGRIHPEYSAHLVKIFATEDIAGKAVEEFILSQADIQCDALDSATTALYSILGEDEMNFDFNAPLLPTELAIQISEEQRYISLTWSPILEDDTVDKLMVSVRDVTELKQAEAEAQKQKEQLVIVGQLLNISADKFLSFEEATQQYINENRTSIKKVKSEEDKHEAVSLLFRNMHTIKGNCRTYNFDKLSNTAHEVESVYTQLRDGNLDLWDEEKLLADLEKTECALKEYSHIYHNVLEQRRSGDSTKRGKGFWMQSKNWSCIKDFIQNRKYEALEQYVNQVNAVNIEKVLDDLITSLPSIAIQLDKKSPKVEIAANNISINDHAQKLVTDVFSHMLRNCVDHGIETTNERIEKNKPEQGTISIHPRVDKDMLNIAIKDDGKGLNIAYLTKKGLDKGILGTHSTQNLSDIAQLIFLSGVSTKEAVTDISGRGVGMDAVKSFLQENDGDISINLLSEQANSEGFIPFELIASLPATHFVVRPNTEEHCQQEAKIQNLREA